MRKKDNLLTPLAIIFAILAVILLALVASKRQARKVISYPQEKDLTLPKMSASDEVPEIEKDLDNTDLSDLDSELSSIDSEL